MCTEMTFSFLFFMLDQGYGTALGVITHLHETGKLKRAFYTQSTPYHQGSRFVQPGSDLLRSPPISYGLFINR